MDRHLLRFTVISSTLLASALSAQSEWLEHSLPTHLGQGLQWGGVTASDFDRDGDVDIVGTTGGWIFLLENDGQMGFTSTGLYAVNVPQLCSADMDGDGESDLIGLAVGGGLNVVIGIHQGAGSFHFSNRFNFPSGTGLIEIDHPADLDGDGDIDLLVRDHTTAISWLENDGNANLSHHPLGPLPSGEIIHYIRSRDLDGDGDVDLVAAGLETQSWWENDGTGIFAHHAIDIPFDERRHFAALADLDLDGDLEYVGHDHGSGDSSFRASAILPDPGAFQEQLFHYPVARSSYLRGSGHDFDGDGDVDLAISASEHSVVILNGIGFSRWTKQEAYSDYDRVAPAVDLDQDGDLDLLVWRGTRFAWLENQPHASSLAAWLDQPTGPGTVRASLEHGEAGRPYFTAITTDARNAGTGLGNGPYFGLYITRHELLWQSLQRQPHRGRFDLDGSWSQRIQYLPNGITPGTTLYYVCIYYPSGSQTPIASVPRSLIVQ